MFLLSLLIGFPIPIIVVAAFNEDKEGGFGFGMDFATAWKLEGVCRRV